MNLKYAIRTLVRNRTSTLLCCLSLAAGVAAGLVLIAKISFEMNYEDFYPDTGRIHMIHTIFTDLDGSGLRGGQEPYWSTSGGVAVGFADEVPGVEAATRFTYLGSKDEMVFRYGAENKLKGEFILADSNFFDVLPRPMTQGDFKEIMGVEMNVAVSRTMAERIGPRAVGTVIRFEDYPGRELTIAGVFEDIPENTMMPYDAVISLPSIGRFMGDGSMDWVGNERYRSFVKLAEVVDPASLTPAIRAMQEKYQDLEYLNRNGLDIGFKLAPIASLHSDDKDTRRMVLMMGIIAVAVLVTTVLNYILAVLSTLAGRTREIGTRKTFGAGRREVRSLIFTENLLLMTVSLVLSIAVIVAFGPLVRQVLYVGIDSLFTVRSLGAISVTVIILLATAGWLPSLVFAATPVASAYRAAAASGRKWKPVMLFVQFGAAAFLVMLLVLVGRQYRMMVTEDPGYKHENVVWYSADGASPSERLRALEAVSTLPFVTAAGTGSVLPSGGASGNNVYLPGNREKELFNFAELYWVDSGWIDVLGFDIIEGENFTDGVSAENDLLVSRRFADMIAVVTGWTDGVVGESIGITERDGGICRITGVYEDIMIGNLAGIDLRPSAMSYHPGTMPITVVELTERNHDNLAAIQSVLDGTLPEITAEVIPLSQEINTGYHHTRMFRKSITIVCLITLLIVLAGLAGWLRDELGRMSRSIAIRRVCGARIREILTEVCRIVLTVALPATALGLALAALAGRHWMHNFHVQVRTPIVVYLCVAAVILAVIIIITVLTAYGIVRRNPAKTFKSE